MKKWIILRKQKPFDKKELKNIWVLRKNLPGKELSSKKGGRKKWHPKYVEKSCFKNEGSRINCFKKIFEKIKKYIILWKQKAFDKNEPEKYVGFKEKVFLKTKESQKNVQKKWALFLSKFYLIKKNPKILYLDFKKKSSCKGRNSKKKDVQKMAPKKLIYFFCLNSIGKNWSTTTTLIYVEESRFKNERSKKWSFFSKKKTWYLRKKIKK